jgi:hypothetical protein
MDLTMPILQHSATSANKRVRKDPLADFTASEKADQTLNSEKMRHFHEEEMLRLRTRATTKAQKLEIKKLKLDLKGKHLEVQLEHERERTHLLRAGVEPTTASSSSFVESVLASPFVQIYDLSGLGQLNMPMLYDTFTNGDM